MAKKINTQIIKTRRSYTPREVMDLLCVSKLTVIRWMKEGLRPLKRNTRPLLIMGSDLKFFLNQKQQARKTKLKDDEYFCVRCQKAVKPKRGTEKIVKTVKTIGKENKDQFNKLAICSICGAKICRFTSLYQKD